MTEFLRPRSTKKNYPSDGITKNGNAKVRSPEDITFNGNKSTLMCCYTDPCFAEFAKYLKDHELDNSDIGREFRAPDVAALDV